MVFLLVVTFGAIALYEVPGLVREKLWRELAAFTSVWLVAFSLSLLLMLGVKLPSPTEGIEYVIKQAAQLWTGGK